MTGYPGGGRERRFAPEALARLATAVFERSGMSAEDAALVAETLVAADVRGVHSHGLLRVPEYVRKLSAGGVDPRGRPRVARDAGAALVVDGGNSMGQVGATFAMRQAIARARTTGVAAVAVGGSNHCGAMAYYAMLALPDDMIGVAATNALPTMAPWGGRDKILGINPVGIAIPAGEEPAVVFDGAFSGSSHGKIRVYQQKGLAIPGGWAFDADGRPTTDPARALAGLLRPIGGFKGTGLALVTGLLSTMLSGAAYGTELGDMVEGPRPGRDGHFLVALRIAAFEDVPRFKARMDGVVREIRGGRTAPGFDRIHAPGHLEAETERRYRREGIPLNALTVDGLRAEAERLGVDAAPLRR